MAEAIQSEQRGVVPESKEIPYREPDEGGLRDVNKDTAERPRSNGSTKEEAKPVPKPSKLKGLMDKLGLDVGTLVMMFKGSIAPTIGIAMYQSDSVANTYTTLGYLVGIMAVLSMPIMPRAKFLQTLILNILGVCLGAAIALLGIWSSVKAREHTTSPGTKAAYNSSQSVVCAIFLFTNIYVVNVLRAKIPAFQFPVIVYSIFANVAFTFGPFMQTTAAAELFTRHLLQAFLTAFALGLAVNLIVFPVSSRTVVFKEQAGYIMAVRGTLNAQATYLQSLENSDMFAAGEASAGDQENSNNANETKKEDAKDLPSSTRTPQALALKGSVAGLIALHGKLLGDIDFAKREIAWGKLSAKDIDQIFKLLHEILIPLIGMSTIMDIFERIAQRRGWVKSANTEYDRAEAWEHGDEEMKANEKKTWNEVMKTIHEPFAVIVAAMDEGMEHAGLLLELLPAPKTKKNSDEEAKGTDPGPGDPDFMNRLEQKMLDFYARRGHALKAWAREKGLSTEQFDSENATHPSTENYKPSEAQHRRDQQQLYLILYMEHLLYSAGTAIVEFVRFADKKVEDGTMNKNHLIVPGQRRIRKWILNIGREDISLGHEAPDSLEAGNGRSVYMGSGFSIRWDPEHLPPTTAWQRFGNAMRAIPRFFRSPESAFGFRVACATLTIGVIAYLKDTQNFFQENRFVWAMIMIAIGMTMTSGQAIFGLLGRVGGTLVAMVVSIVSWYIVDQKTPGVLVMLWLSLFLGFYFIIKYPRFIQITIISIVTQVLIIGYELQVRKIGIKKATASGQKYYPIYELAPYRLATVAAGCFVAFVWTVFPYPISDRSWLRKDLGSTLYLLANYHSVVNSTIRAKAHGTEGDMELKTSPGRRLEKVRHKIFGKLLLLLPSLQQHTDWQRWEPTIGGKFPRETYEAITTGASNIMQYLALMSYTTKSWSRKPTKLEYPNSEPTTRRVWMDDLTKLIDSLGQTNHDVTSTLALLSAAVTEGSALPPYIKLPEAYDLTRRLEALDNGILDARHVEEPGYSAYAVMQVASSLITDDLSRLIGHVKDLVGETDFTFTVSMSASSIATTDTGSNSGKGKQE